MARIRSVHPGLWTDEAFVSLSPLARLLLIGLWNEADDQGVFEWKPNMLKLRLLPVDNVDITDLLGELSVADCVGKFECEGRDYGAIRNFRKFQRPKSPNAIHPIPPHFRNYVGLSGENGEKTKPERTGFPQKGENGFQMEEGGGRREDGKKEKAPPNPPEGGGEPPVEGVREAFDAYNAAAKRLGLPIARDLTDERRRKIRARLRSSGGLPRWTEALERIGASAFLTGQTERGFRADLDFLCQAKSFQRLIEGYYADRGQAPPSNGSQAPPIEDEARLAKIMDYCRRHREWTRSELGPKPNEPGCQIPAHLLQPGDGEGWTDTTEH